MTSFRIVDCGSSAHELGVGQLEVVRTQDKRFRIPQQGAMQVPVDIYLTDELFSANAEHLLKLARIASLPGLERHLAVLPDVHFKAKNFIPTGVSLWLRGAVAPQLIGPPNDSMMVVRTGFKADELDDSTLDRLFDAIRARVAMFRRQSPQASAELVLDLLCHGPVGHLAEWGFEAGDLRGVVVAEARLDGGRRLTAADIAAVLPPSAARPASLPDFVPWNDVITAGRHCLGVIDGGGHFLEFNVVDGLMEPELCAQLGLEHGEVLAALHVGAADVGLIAHKTFIPESHDTIRTYPVGSETYERFRVACAAATNFGYANRLFLVAQLREALAEVTGREVRLSVLSDAPHDMLEVIDDGAVPLFNHRKGVVRPLPGAAFPPSHPYHGTGLPFLFPTALGQDGYLACRPHGDADGFYICSHGAGRSMSRDEAIASFSDDELENRLRRLVRLYRYGSSSFAAQAPEAHKDAASVLGVLRQFNFARIAARLRPLAALKG